MNRRRFLALASLGVVALARGKMPAAPAVDPQPVFMFPEGTFLVKDAGTLELGVFHDTLCGARNGFDIFAETFENVAYVRNEPVPVLT